MFKSQNAQRKDSHPSSPIEIGESESKIEEVSAPADPDNGNIDPITELDIDVHDFSIGQLEKDVTRGPKTSKDNNPIEDENVCFIIRNITQSWLRSLCRFLRTSQKLLKVQWSLQSPLLSQRQGSCWLRLRMKIMRILIFLALWTHSYRKFKNWGIFLPLTASRWQCISLLSFNMSVFENNTATMAIARHQAWKQVLLLQDGWENRMEITLHVKFGKMRLAFFVTSTFHPQSKGPNMANTHCLIMRLSFTKFTHTLLHKILGSLHHESYVSM